MRMSGYFPPTLKERPSDAAVASHDLMLRAGLIRRSAPGIYAWMPLGLKVLRKIEDVVRAEQNRAGALEMLMPTLQSADDWHRSGRYDAYGPELLRITDRNGRELIYGPTNEEVITRIVGENVRSYRNLPCLLYHVQWKFRDEIRPRFGVMRCREFLMKDAYSFDLDLPSARTSYWTMFLAYLRTFDALGLKAIPVVADAGPIGGDLSHEFVIPVETGETSFFCDAAVFDRLPSGGACTTTPDAAASDITRFYARTDDKHDAALFARQVPEDRRLSLRGIEVGHLFQFGRKYSDPMGSRVVGPDGSNISLLGGSYGIGVSRLVAAVIEVFHDAHGITWPWNAAPFHVGVVDLRPGDHRTNAACERLVAALSCKGADVLHDDRDERAGVKFSDMDLLGSPWQAVIGVREAEDGTVEVRHRTTRDKTVMPFERAVEILSAPPPVTDGGGTS